eukprot:CAMPEP_0117010004 /NCGR_PEP_ID=MMETSP0472-20121206/8932_1 /TAXON_ID=693140 ORGANISM="Tiarina fusus, Strain LIS" /NCGR_SAMPLE_ID=MMETSP0472 /ASSEMBLY_ACC=CAM_ASM_000603 /LENGTH=630 /DNA_ID=CAMNT_0004712435 /DNA_START=85 /DNA_END=1977 /DNA_ORIENTATION=+
MTGSSSSLKLLAFGVICPFLVGILLKIYVIPDTLFQAHVAPLIPEWTVQFLISDVASNDTGTSQRNLNSPKCRARFQKLLENNGGGAVWDDMTVFLHRNGDAISCGGAGTGRTFVDMLEDTYASTYSDCPAFLNKYQVESLLTKTLHQLVDSCFSLESDGNKKAGFLGFCDMGEHKTPILLDHDDLVPVVSTEGKTSLPCRFHTREGLRISQLKQLKSVLPPPCKLGDESGQETCSAELSKEVHLYAVPAGRVFMFAPAYVGEIFYLPHVEGSDDKQISLEVLSLSPRVFDVYDFFSREESQTIVDGAKAEGRDSHRIKRSTTGASSHSINSRRTSESGFDTHGQTSVIVKKRCFAALGFDEYWESHGDGLQILRYNLTTAYNTHLDYFEDKNKQMEHDFDSAHKGGNRFATILMYMSDLGPEDGGETVFPTGWPPHLPEADRIPAHTALEQLRASDRGSVLQRGSWEEDLVSKCRTRLAIRPHSSRAVLFYSQLPNGELDQASLHGACPVLDGQKYAANLWVWNTPRQGYPGHPVNEKFKKKSNPDVSSSPSVSITQITATFKNSGSDPTMAGAELYYEDQFWGKLGRNDPVLRANTFQGHVWNVKVGGNVVKTWKIQNEGGEEQDFIL